MFSNFRGSLALREGLTHFSTFYWGISDDTFCGRGPGAWI
jgi:hypothetical protein